MPDNNLPNRSLFFTVVFTLIFLLISTAALTWPTVPTNAAPAGLTPSAWYKADSGVTGTAAVTQWSDQSGNGVNVTQNNDTRQPRLLGNQANFNPVVNFAGGETNEEVLTGTLSAISGDSPHSVYTVYRNASGGAGRQNLFSIGIPTLNQNIAYHPNFAGGKYYYFFGNDLNVSTVTPFDTWQLDSLSYQNTGDNNAQERRMFTSGRFLASDGVNGFLDVPADPEISVGGYNARTNQEGAGMKGDIAEMLIYPAQHSTAERIQIESYLALKYGFTLDQSVGDYLDSTGQSVFDLDAEGTSWANVVGLAKDTTSSLDQRISKSVNSDAILTLATDATDFAAANSTHADTLVDNSYLVAGSTGDTTFGSAFAGGSNNRMNRVWRASETGTVGAVQLAIPSTVAFPNSEQNLVVSNDLTFDANDTVLPLTQVGDYLTASVDLVDGTYFSFASSVPGLNVNNQSGITVTEGQTTGSFEVVLNAKPSANVTVEVTSSQVSAATVDKPSLTFTPDDWNVAQTVTVTPEEDADATNEEVTVTFAIASGSATEYTDVATEERSVTVDDDEVAQVIVKPIDNVTDEDGDTGIFSVVLSAAPQETVTINFTSSDTGEGTLPESTVSFDSTDWNVAKTITVEGVNTDNIPDGDVEYSITSNSVSDDSAFNDLEIAAVAMINQNTDAPDIKITTSGSITSEAGGTVTVTVQALSNPQAEVTLPLSVNDESEGKLSSDEVVLPANSQDPVEVTLTGVNDEDIDGDIAYSLVTSPTVSTDTDYNGLNKADFLITNEDNDVDTDGDLVPDEREIRDGTDATIATDYLDSDGDLVPDYVEEQNQTAPDDADDFQDSDNGGTPDYVEATLYFNRSETPGQLQDDSDDQRDSDGDGLSDYQEVRFGSQPGNADDDNDGIPTSQELAGPNNGDANGDGITDYTQPNVGVVSSPVTNSEVTLEVTGGCQTIAALQAYQEEDLAPDVMADYPLGLLGFSLTCAADATDAEVRVILDREYATTAWDYKQYTGSEYRSIQDKVTYETVDINGVAKTAALYTLNDGGDLDTDGVVNGTIVDSAGPAVMVEEDEEQEEVAPGPDKLLRTGGQSKFILSGSGLGLMLLGILSFWRNTRRDKK